MTSKNVILIIVILAVSVVGCDDTDSRDTNSDGTVSLAECSASGGNYKSTSAASGTCERDLARDIAAGAKSVNDTASQSSKNLLEQGLEQNTASVNQSQYAGAANALNSGCTQVVQLAGGKTFCADK